MRTIFLILGRDQYTNSIGAYISLIEIEREIPLLDKLNVPLKDFEEFKDLLYEVVGDDGWFSASNSPMDKLSVPLKDLERYNETLDEVLDKLKEIETIKHGTKH